MKDTLTATTGEKYVVVDAKKKIVRKLNDFKSLGDVINEDVLLQNSLLDGIHTFLKNKGLEASRKRGKNENHVNSPGYRITFDVDLGFVILDSENYMAVLEDFDNPCPTPREVYEYIINRKKRSTSTKKAKFIKAPKVEDKEKSVDDKKEEELTLEEYEVIRANTLKEASEMAPKKLSEYLFRLIPNRKFNHRLNKFIKEYKSKTMRPSKFKSSVIYLLQTHDFSPPRLAAKKFVGLDWYEISELTDEGENVFFVTRNEGKIRMSKSEFMTRYLLHLEPKAMPQLWRMMKNEITAEDFLDSPIIKNDIEAKYIEFTVSSLRNYNKEVKDAVDRLLFDWEEPNPLSIMYKNMLSEPIRKNDYIEVTWRDMHAIYEGKVASLTNGIRIRYEDGDVVPLYKWQEYKVTSKR